jgi:hypothetical protein
MQSACQTKLGTVTRKPPKLETKWAFLSKEAKMIYKNSPKISNFSSSPHSR